ncbi:MAG: hypothetical protein IKB51_04090 [Clostridia bacterium]|nr:hypothetical protein [Clostridia bacterium]
MTKRKEQTSVCEQKKKDLTQGLAATVRSKKRIDILYRIFTPYRRQIISQKKKNVKCMFDIYEEILEDFDVVQKWRRILMCALLALCVTIGVLSLCGIVNMFMGAV